jgi:hypothetical protein
VSGSVALDTGKRGKACLDAKARMATSREAPAGKKRSRDLSWLCAQQRRNSRRALPQNEIGAAIIVKGHNTGTNHAMRRGCSTVERPLERRHLSIMATTKNTKGQVVVAAKQLIAWDGEAPHERDASHDPGELVHADADCQ